jgi:hypothetical protein
MDADSFFNADDLTIDEEQRPSSDRLSIVNGRGDGALEKRSSTISTLWGYLMSKPGQPDPRPPEFEPRPYS